MNLADLDTWTKDKAPDIDFDVHICDKRLSFFGFEVLAPSRHCFMIDWGNGTKYVCQGSGAWEYYSCDYPKCESESEYRVAVYADAGSEILGLDVTCTDINERYVARLDTSRCRSLRELKTEDCLNLDLSGNPHLKVLRCELALFDSLDVSSNPELEELYIDAPCSKLQSLDLSGCPALRDMTCRSTDIRSLELSHNPDLESLDVSISPFLSCLDLSGCPALRDITCCNTDIRSLELRHNPDLESLDVSSSQFLSCLDLSACSKLRHLDFSDCPALTELRLPELSMLEYVCYNNSGIIGRKEDWLLKYLLKRKDNMF